jgi:hypothetical protein
MSVDDSIWAIARKMHAISTTINKSGNHIIFGEFGELGLITGGW